MKILPVNYNYNKFLNFPNSNNSKNNYTNQSYSPVFYGLKGTYALLNTGFKTCSINNNIIDTDSKKIIIDSADKLVALSNSPNMWNRKFVLTKDIDLSTIDNFKPIGTFKHPFTGKFDGNGCIISGLKINSEDCSNIGLFGVCDGAKLKNFNIKNAQVNAKSQSGILSGVLKNCEINDCKIYNSKISGTNKIGTLAGLSNNSIFNNNYIEAGVSCSKITSGGIIGYDDSSEINECFVDIKLSSPEETGGIIGYSNYSTINNSCVFGDIQGTSKTGKIIGWGDGVSIHNSYSNISQKIPEIGYNNDCNTNIYSLLSKNCTLDNNLWLVKNNKFKCLPRLKSMIDRETSEKIFLDDLNFNIASGIFDIKSKEYNISFEKPKHFPENDDLINKAKNSKSADELHDLFGDLALTIYYDLDNKQYDEVFLEIIKNPKFEPNRTYSIWDYNDNYSCTPLFILTTLNRPYLLQEMLKSDKIFDIEKRNGNSYYAGQTVMDRAINHNLVDCVYVLLNAKNMKYDIERYKSKVNSNDEIPQIMKDMFNLYPDIPDYTSFKTQEKTVDKINSINEVLLGVDIPVDFEDIQGNSIINIAAQLDDEEKGLKILLNAIYRNADIEHKNNNGDTALKIALDKKKSILIAGLLNHNAEIKTANSDGENAILVFSKNNDENMANNLIEFAVKKGMSINSQDNKGNTPLINAINLGNKNVVKNLLALGSGINLSDLKGQTPLHYACFNQNSEIIKILLENTANIFTINEEGKTPKDYLNDDELIKLYENYENMYKANNIISNSLDYTSNQLKLIEDFSLDDISERIESANPQEKELLTYNTILLLKKDNTKIKQISDIEGNNILHIASKNKTVLAKELIKLSIDLGLDINSQNKNGKTPLMIAIDAYNDCNNANEKINILGNIKYLLENNPDIELVDNNGQSALHSACKTDNAIILNLLLGKDPKINIKDKMNQTPMNYIETKNVKSEMDKYINRISKGMQ